VRSEAYFYIRRSDEPRSNARVPTQKAWVA